MFYCNVTREENNLIWMANKVSPPISKNTFTLYFNLYNYKWLFFTRGPRHMFYIL